MGSHLNYLVPPEPFHWRFLWLDVRSDRQVANILGVVFIVVGILGFVPNPLVGPEGVFMTKAAHKILHALVGVLLLVSGQNGSMASRRY